MWRKALLLFICLLFSCQITAASPVDISKLKVNLAPTTSDSELIRRSDLIVAGTTSGRMSTHPTKERLQQYRVVNFTQKIRVSKVLKGLPRSEVNLLTVGVEPLPDASDPLNKSYTGPLAEGEYILFLTQVTGTDLYSLTGVWQGVYPIMDNRTIALKGFGYPRFDRLTIAELQKTIGMQKGR